MTPAVTPPETKELKPFEPQPGKPLTQFKLMLMLGYEPGVLRKHVLVYGFIVDWWHGGYGNALASVRHIVSLLKERDPYGRGLYMGDVHSALNDLVEWGWLKQEKGAGRRASRYIPVWDKSRSVLKSPNANDNEISVLGIPNTDVLGIPNTTAISVLKSPNEDSLTGPGLRTGLQVCENDMFKATPTAQLADGLQATAALTALGGFDEFWKSYPRRHGKTKAAAAYAKLNASPELHATIMVAVRDWSAHYVSHGTEKKWIPEPANWIANERWDEDLPVIHDDAKGAAITKAKANALPKAANDNDNLDDDGEEYVEDGPYDMVNDVGPFTPFGTFKAEITEIETSGENNEDFKLTLEIESGTATYETQHSFCVKHPNKELEERGRQFIQDIIDATGVTVTSDTDVEEVLFIPLQATIDKRLAISYRPLPLAA